MDKVDFNGFVLVGASYKEGESYQGNETSGYKEENSERGKRRQKVLPLPYNIN